MLLTLSESQSRFPYLPNGAGGTDHTGLLGLRECMESNCHGAWYLGDPQFMISLFLPASTPLLLVIITVFCFHRLWLHLPYLDSITQTQLSV